MPSLKLYNYLHINYFLVASFAGASASLTSGASSLATLRAHVIV